MAESDDDQPGGSSVGERLRLAREEKGIPLDDIARQTRIPLRHLEHIERGEWAALPAVTYSVGFARSYATAVGLDGAAIGAELRQELGAARNTSGPAAAYYEPADPARVPPRWIAIVATVIAALLIGGYLFWRSTAVDDSVEPQLVDTEVIAPKAAPAQQPGAQPAAAATGPVVLTATQDVWMRVYEAGGGAALFQDILKAGQTYQVPATAQAPQLRTSRPQALRVTVGSTVVPPLGPPEKLVSNVSLKAADLAARAQGQAAPAAPPPAAPVPQR
jgi:transcriptional regulator with XRE-family HTH domain